MNTYEKLQEAACKDGIEVVDYPSKVKESKDYTVMALSLSEIIQIQLQKKACVLAEELGHHYTSVGNIIDMEYIGNQKQERQARLWAYKSKTSDLFWSDQSLRTRL